MPPANLHGESTPDFIVPIYIECRFEFIEAGLGTFKVMMRPEMLSPDVVHCL